jgi:predicted nucleic acid-binding protein
MTAPVFVDTNVLVSTWDATRAAKRDQALAWMHALWDSQRGRTSLQVLNEFYVTVTRRLEPAVAPADAQRYVRTLFAWEPVPLDSQLLEQGWAVQQRLRLSFWDALIVAAALTASCSYLLTEDLQHDQDLDGVRVLNPFRAEPRSLRD